MITRSPFHLVEFSPWPLLGSISSLFLVRGIVRWFHLKSITTINIGLILILIIIYNWWRDTRREASSIGHHTSYVIKGLKWGIILFITSEIIFFFAFFWAFFHSSLSPNIELGCIWPPFGIYAINPFSIPLLNTAVLLASGITVTWTHHRLLLSNKLNSFIALSITISLGVYFSILQISEYLEAPFSISDSIYGRTFFVATGFHGLHVLIGTSILFVSLLRLWHNQFSATHHFGFEASAWYWHFVDVIWIFLYISIYWWRS